jgi:hypothetical protein
MASSPKDEVPKRLFMRFFLNGPELAAPGTHDIFGMRRLKLPSETASNKNVCSLPARHPEKDKA